MQEINVLSLFDGIACGRVALERAGVKINRYIASEINAHAIKCATTNYPDIEEIGDIKELNVSNLPKIDLVIGGSPCQGFSSSGKGLNFKDPRSQLFFEFVRILREVKPKYFLLENVKMRKEWSDVISKYMGVSPIEINSSLVSAQNRSRLYWTNIPNVSLPADKGVCLSDILENEEGMQLNKGTIIGRRLNEKGHREDYNHAIPIVQCLEVRRTNTNKSNCITTVDKDNVLTPLPFGRYPDAFRRNLPFRYYTIKEYCRLQTLPDNYTDMISDQQARKALGNCWTVDVIAHIFSGLKGVFE